MATPLICKVLWLYPEHSQYQYSLEDKNRVHELLMSVLNNGGTYELSNVFENDNWYSVYTIYKAE